MNAAVTEVMNMVVEDRITRLESDVTEIKGDVKALGKQFVDFKTEVIEEFSSVRTEIAKEFGSVRTEMQGLKTEIAKEFGSVRLEMASLRTSIERNKVWMLCTGISTVMSIAAIVGFKLH